MYSERRGSAAPTWAPPWRPAPCFPPPTPLPPNQSPPTRVPRHAQRELYSARGVKTNAGASNKGIHGKLQVPNLGNSGLNQLVGPVNLQALKANANKMTRRGQGGPHLISSELLRQLLLPFLSCCTINTAREQNNAIAKLGASPSATPPSSNQSGKALKSLASLAKPRRDL